MWENCVKFHSRFYIGFPFQHDRKIRLFFLLLSFEHFSVWANASHNKFNAFCIHRVRSARIHCQWKCNRCRQFSMQQQMDFAVDFRVEISIDCDTRQIIIEAVAAVLLLHLRAIFSVRFHNAAIAMAGASLSALRKEENKKYLIRYCCMSEHWTSDTSIYYYLIHY